MLKDKIINIVLISLADIIALSTLAYLFTHHSSTIPIPAAVWQTLPGKPGLPAAIPNAVTIPTQNASNISTVPDISLTASSVLSSSTVVSILPATSYTTVFSNDKKTIRILTTQPLLPSTAYQITVTDPRASVAASWVFATQSTAIDPGQVSAVQQIQSQTPYRDPFNHFSVYYAAPIDTYYVTIYNDLRSDVDKQAALAWFKSQGVTDLSPLNVVWVPSTSL